MTDDALIATCILFRSGLLDGAPSRGMCSVVSVSLQGYLRAIGIATTMMVSTPVIGEWKGHIWLALKDGRALDPTADQYGGNRPAVYLGRPDTEIHCGARPFIVGEAISLMPLIAGKKRRRRKVGGTP